MTCVWFLLILGNPIGLVTFMEPLSHRLCLLVFGVLVFFVAARAHTVVFVGLVCECVFREIPRMYKRPQSAVRGGVSGKVSGGFHRSNVLF